MRSLPLWEILVPHSWNNGRHISVAYHKEWDKKVLDIAGGMTLLRASMGSWVCPYSGKLYKEIMIPVRIACTRDQIKEIATMSLEYYDQLVIMVTLISEEVLFFSKDNKNEN